VFGLKGSKIVMNLLYMSEDPYLTGMTVTQQVLGIQSNGKTHATIKHFAGNESEYQRECWTAVSRIPSRAMHEIYDGLLPLNPNVRSIALIGANWFAGQATIPWLFQARALIEAWYPGQNDGDVVADALFGVTNPSGKLLVTFGNNANEAAYATEAQYPGLRENNGLGGGEGGFESNGSPQLVTHYPVALNLAGCRSWPDRAAPGA